MSRTTIQRLRSEPGIVLLVSLLFTCIFFIEYLPPLEHVHMYSDIEGYHYPILHFAFVTLSSGHIPEWDPTIYCGLSLVGSVQAALFYPPNWLMFVAHLHRQHL